MEKGRLNEFFHSDEFECNCGCGLFNLDPDHFEKLTRARRIADVPFVVNSGCRCPSWNYKVGGTKASGHLIGKATDPKAATIGIMIAVLRGAIQAEMDGIGIGPGFIHMDTKGRKLIKCYEKFTLSTRGLRIT